MDNQQLEFEFIKEHEEGLYRESAWLMKSEEYYNEKEDLECSKILESHGF